MSESYGLQQVDFEHAAQTMAYRLGLAQAAMLRMGALSMDEPQCIEALRIADRLDSADPEFDDCAAAAAMLRECVELARMEPAATELRIAAGNALRAAALGVVVHMEGRMPGRGWLKDNNKSREALAELVRVLGV